VLFVRRDVSPTPRLRNEEDVQRALEAWADTRRVRVVGAMLGSLPLVEQLRLVQSACVIVSVHGCVACCS
jgi:capsular polysaccharide biosynthesis protein